MCERMTNLFFTHFSVNAYLQGVKRAGMKERTKLINQYIVLKKP